MNITLRRFLTAFEQSFQPPDPARRHGWLVSKVWSDYMREWLEQHFEVKLERQLADKRRLDAALWPKGRDQTRRPHGVIEWEWDDWKDAADFPYGDFQKLFTVPGAFGVAIIQTRVDGTRGSNSPTAS